MLVWGITDIGRVRTQNQDALFFDAGGGGKPAVLAVCDGMGGENAGETAGRVAMQVISEELKNLQNARHGSDAKSLREIISNANRRVCEMSRSAPEYSGMGTTAVVAAARRDGGVTVANVGDSRAYAVTRDGIKLVTHDHSVAGDLLFYGKITEEEARRRRDRNQLTRAIGTEDEIECDIFELSLNPGEFLLLCSDGLTNMVDEQEILFEIIHGDPSGACARLAQTANGRGGKDNITAALLSV